MKVFYTTDAHGVYLGSVVVSVADTEDEARESILASLRQEFPGESEGELCHFTVKEMADRTKVIWNGDY